MSIEYEDIQNMIESEPERKFNSGQLQSLNNIMVNFDREVIPSLVEDEDVENYTRLMDSLIEMQKEFIDLYYDLYPPFRHEVQRLNQKMESDNKSNRK